MECVACEKKIEGTQIFGDYPNELCWDCYSALLWDYDTDITYNFVGHKLPCTWRDLDLVLIPEE